ncbi:hypothetical protein [Nonomuraea sp. NPDC049400]|uniref:hypothetical protein n=1 Tax=Nonomuraea sp. NPDC049400 TaxID=3364352 RepID=UPI0037BD863D
MTPVRLGVLAMAALALATSCSTPDTGPTAAQAGETLKAHITQLMRETGLRNVEVTDPGGKDVSCGEGRTKRTYGAKSTFDGNGEVLINQLTGTLTGTWGYKVDRVFIPDSAKTILKLAPSRTVVTLDLPTEHEVAVVGETDCVKSEP